MHADGYMTSDSDAIEDIYDQHNYTKTGAEACAAALNQGECDMDSGATFTEHLLEAVNTGLISASTLDRALYNVFKCAASVFLFFLFLLTLLLMSHQGPL
jgi:beta-D-xylosidase 4